MRISDSDLFHIEHTKYFHVVHVWRFLLEMLFAKENQLKMPNQKNKYYLCFLFKLNGQIGQEQSNIELEINVNFFCCYFIGIVYQQHLCLGLIFSIHSKLVFQHWFVHSFYTFSNGVRLMSCRQYASTFREDSNNSIRWACRFVSSSCLTCSVFVADFTLLLQEKKRRFLCFQFFFPVIFWSKLCRFRSYLSAIAYL